MLPLNLERSSTAVVALVAALVLALTIGCQSTPEAEEAPAPLEPEPAEEYEPTDDPYAEPNDPPPAAGGEQPGAQQPMAPQGAQVDQEELEKFADVVIATADLEQEIEERMREVESQEEAQQVEMEILAELEQQVLAAGLTLEEYGAIAEQLQFDADLQQRLTQILEDRGQGHLLQQPTM